MLASFAPAAMLVSRSPSLRPSVMLRTMSAARWRSSSSYDQVDVGGAVTDVRPSTSVNLVPRGFFDSTHTGLHPLLRWMAQKDSLGQDMLLLAPPAERRRARHLALAFCELIQAEVECVTISADTTESDLKQRRELDGRGGVSWSDGPPVRAALGGRVLLLDGLERAERNVLPTLNNLLENRELSLDDGRLLVEQRRMLAAAATGDAAAATDAAQFAAVHPLFRVIALAAPAPPFEGRPLDPPLRSRFNAALVPPVSAQELAAALHPLSVLHLF